MVWKYFILICFFFFTTRLCIACTCVTMDISEAMQSADEIFIGRLVSLVPLDNFENRERSLLNVEFEVLKKWKGSKESKMNLIIGGNSCGYYLFESENIYLVFAHNEFTGWRKVDIEAINDPKMLTLVSCSRTSAINSFTKNTVNTDILILDEKFPETIKLSDKTFKKHYLIIWLSLIFTLTAILFMFKRIII